MPSMKEIWEEFAGEKGGEYIPGKGFKQPFVVYNHNGFNIILATYVVSTGQSTITYTTVFVPFKNEKEIQFRLVKRNIFHRMFTSRKLISTGFDEFDSRYHIKGNDEIYIARLFSNHELQELISRQKQMLLTIAAKGIYKSLYKNFNKQRSTLPKEDESFLVYQCTGVIKDKERLHGFFKLIEKVLDGFLDLNITRQL